MKRLKPYLFNLFVFLLISLSFNKPNFSAITQCPVILLCKPYFVAVAASVLNSFSIVPPFSSIAPSSKSHSASITSLLLRYCRPYVVIRHYYVVITFLRFITLLLRHYYVVITVLLRCHYVIITLFLCYFVVVTSLLRAGDALTPRCKRNQPKRL